VGQSEQLCPKKEEADLSHSYVASTFRRKLVPPEIRQPIVVKLNKDANCHAK
jgi:hypothetical protein